jgi:hypothetical protein
MIKEDLIQMINDHKDAIKFIEAHMELNPASSDLSMWKKAVRKLKKRVKELEENLHLGEYDE